MHLSISNEACVIGSQRPFPASSTEATRHALVDTWEFAGTATGRPWRRCLRSEKDCGSHRQTGGGSHDFRGSRWRLRLPPSVVIVAVHLGQDEGRGEQANQREDRDEQG